MRGGIRREGKKREVRSEMNGREEEMGDEKKGRGMRSGERR